MSGRDLSLGWGRSRGREARRSSPSAPAGMSGLEVTALHILTSQRHYEPQFFPQNRQRATKMGPCRAGAGEAPHSRLCPRPQ